MSPEMVPATLVPKRNAATKLKNAAQTTACPGVSTRVETTVAIELAASWNPLRKSKIRARKTKKIMSVSILDFGLRILDQACGAGGAAYLIRDPQSKIQNQLSRSSARCARACCR